MRIKYLGFIGLISMCLAWIYSILSSKLFLYSKTNIDQRHYNFIKELKFYGHNETKIVLLYTKIYNSEWTIPLGYTIFESCPIKDCFVTTSKLLTTMADLVIFHMRENYPSFFSSFMSNPLLNMPKDIQTGGYIYQKRLFLMIESPYHKWANYSLLKDFFHLTSTYTSDSDLPTPYGGYKPFNGSVTREDIFKKPNLISKIENVTTIEKNVCKFNCANSYGRTKAYQKSRTTAWLVTHCMTPNFRENIAEALSHFVTIHVYGQCRDFFSANFPSIHKGVSKFVFHYIRPQYVNPKMAHISPEMTKLNQKFESIRNSTLDFTKPHSAFVLKHNNKNNQTVPLPTLIGSDPAYQFTDFEIESLCQLYPNYLSHSSRCLTLLGQIYKFYMAFENSNCREYITEKFWYNALSHGMVPIVYGPPLRDYTAVAPPAPSFIHIDQSVLRISLTHGVYVIDQSKITSVAETIKNLDANDTLYQQYFDWQRFGSIKNYILAQPTPENPIWCNMCSYLHQNNTSKALNPNTTRYSKSYDLPNNGTKLMDLETWWNPQNMCKDPEIIT